MKQKTYSLFLILGMILIPSFIFGQWIEPRPDDGPAVPPEVSNRMQTVKVESLRPDLRAELVAKQPAEPARIEPGLHPSKDGSAFLFGGPASKADDGKELPPGSAPYTAAFGRELSGGIEVTAAGSAYPLKLVPLSLDEGTGEIVGDALEYPSCMGSRVRYSFKGNGVKEDIVLASSPAVDFELAFRLEMDPMLEAHMDGRGNLLVYGPDSVLGGFIRTGDEESAARVLKARQRAPRDHLLYLISAPVVIDGAGREHKGIARYTLEGPILTIHSGGMAHLPAPVTIDPSIVVTTTADFTDGNNEGMISFDADAISRSVSSSGTIGAWTDSGQYFTHGRYGHAAAAYNGYLYLIGGCDGSSYFNDVQYAPIDSDGTIGTWLPTASFSNGRAEHASVAYNGYLYVIGGRYQSDPYQDVQYAPIHADGTLGGFTSTTTLPYLTHGHSSVTLNGYLYLIGGFDGASYRSSVAYAALNADGTVGDWTPTSGFPTGRRYHASVAYGGHLWVIGGEGGTGLLNDVQVAPIARDGTVGAWTAATSLTTARRRHTVMAHNGRLFVLGGHDGASSLSDVLAAPLHPNGSIGAWVATIGFPTTLYGHASIVCNEYLYRVGGTTDGTVAYDDTSIAPINHAAGSDGLVDKILVSSLPVGRTEHSSAARNGYLYVLGGEGTPHRNDVEFAPIDAQGYPGPWQTTSSFTGGRARHTSVEYNGYVYVIGGELGYFPHYNDVQFAPIHADGTLGEWTATTSMPSARFEHTSVAYEGYLYVLGGLSEYGEPKRNDVLFAPIHADGTIGEWTGTTSLPLGRQAHASVAYNGYMYVIGGEASTVWFAPVNPDGTLGSWTNTTPTYRSEHAAAAYNGYMYLSDGYYFTTDLYAPINSNGTVGAWTTIELTDSYAVRHTVEIQNGYVYEIGDENLPTLISWGKLHGPEARGRYSKLLDIGSDQIVDSIGFSDSGNHRTTHLTYAAAPASTAVFGPRTTIPDAEAGTLYTTGPGTCARWVWAHFDLDDTRSATMDGGGLIGRGDVLDFTVNYSTLSSPDASSNAPICAGRTLNLYASTVPGAFFAWTGPNGFTSDLQNPNIPDATAAASGTYSVTASIGACASAPDTTAAEVYVLCIPPVGDGLAGTTAARFQKNGTVINQIDVTYDAMSCSSQKAVIVYGDLSDFSGYQGSAQCDAGNGGTASFDGSTLTGSVWFNIVWTSAATAGHPGFGFDGVSEIERTWIANGLCVTGDDHFWNTCP